MIGGLMYTQVIRKIGNSEGVIIPRNFLEKLGFSCGTIVGLEIINDQLVLKSTRPKYKLEDLVAQMTPENEHPEIFTDPAVGTERVEYNFDKEAIHDKKKLSREG